MTLQVPSKVENFFTPKAWTFNRILGK